jgi:hypothetical protein
MSGLASDGNRRLIEGSMADKEKEEIRLRSVVSSSG